MRKSKFSVDHHELSGEGIAMKSLEERGENIMSGKFQPKISLRNVYLYKVRCRDGRPAPRGKGGAPPRPALKKTIAAPPRPAPQNTIAAQPRPAPPVEVVKTAGRLRGKMKTLKL